ncbi:hypothetical protein [Lyngbya aestuarii]|uniref:hypothetical protein n=1 Tax=Lyngbya aestuarii TaxID=118322 RepID=UPI00403D7B02
MNYFTSAFLLIATSSILITQGCSAPVKSDETKQMGDHNGHQMNHGNGGHEQMPTGDAVGNDHSEHSQGHHTPSTPTNTQAKLTVDPEIKPNVATNLVIDVQDKQGQAIPKFDIFQEKIMHLIVVSDDLDFFSHIHPTYQENGRFVVETNFPQSGNYTLFSDYKPAGQNEEVSVLKAQIPGQMPASSALDLNRTKTLGETKVNLVLSPDKVKAGQEVSVAFDLKDNTNNQPLTDLEPYLGELGHLVIIKRSSPLTRADYIHAHASKDAPAGEVHFMTSFPQPGKYKLWGQFNRGGEIVTADFWVDVE